MPVITSILIAASVALIARYGGLEIWRRFAGRAGRDAAKYGRWSAELFLGWSPAKALKMAYAANAAVIAVPLAIWLLAGRPVFAAASIPAVYLLPKLLYGRARHKRLERIDRQLPDAINVMVSSARAGRSLSQAIAEVAEKVSGPIGQEFGVISREISQGGISVENALARAKARIQVESFSMIATAMIINCSKGGDVLNILERMSESIRELCRLRDKIYTETSEVRAQGKVILLMTPAFGVLVCMFDPEIQPILFETIAGNIILAVVAGLQTISVLWIRRIIRTTI
ncbi:MAG TPA: type II secretion system F family protein [Blastocatellia bacterium]|nr:type II secretion system F family protein [Blastocatellia bacterium]